MSPRRPITNRHRSYWSLFHIVRKLTVLSVCLLQINKQRHYNQGFVVFIRAKQLIYTWTTCFATVSPRQEIENILINFYDGLLNGRPMSQKDFIFQTIQLEIISFYVLCSRFVVVFLYYMRRFCFSNLFTDGMGLQRTRTLACSLYEMEEKAIKLNLQIKLHLKRKFKI